MSSASSSGSSSTYDRFRNHSSGTPGLSFISSNGGHNNNNNSASSLRSPSSSSVVSAASSSLSLTSSTYRHHHSPFLPRTPAMPKPKLVHDTKHEPKTRGSLGVLVVGMGSPLATTLVAGILANRHQLAWCGPRGEPKQANYQGSNTQQPQQEQPQDDNNGNHGNDNDEIHQRNLANASMAAIGGWVSQDQTFFVSRLNKR